MKKRSPSFQLYPDKALAGSDHLRPVAFKAYWKVLFWMWLHSPNQYSMPNTDAAWTRATGLRGKQLRGVRDEIMHPEQPLLKKQRQIVYSNGLKKEAKKQQLRRANARRAGQASAKARQDKTLRGNGCSSVVEPEPNIPTPTPTTSPTTLVSPPSPPREFLARHPEYGYLREHPELAQVTPEQYQSILQQHPKADPGQAVKRALDDAALMGSLREPALFLRKKFEMLEPRLQPQKENWRERLSKH